MGTVNKLHIRRTLTLSTAYAYRHAMTVLTPAQIAAEKSRLLRRLRLVTESLACTSAAYGLGPLASEEEITEAVQDALSAARAENARRASWDQGTAFHQARIDDVRDSTSSAVESLLRAAARAA